MKDNVFNKNECMNQLALFCEKRIQTGKCYADTCETCCINEASNAIENETFKEE